MLQALQYGFECDLSYIRALEEEEEEEEEEEQEEEQEEEEYTKY